MSKPIRQGIKFGIRAITLSLGLLMLMLEANASTSPDMLQEPDTLELPKSEVYRQTPTESALKYQLELTDANRLSAQLGNLLEKVPGVHVTRSGGVGDYIGISLWGSTAAQVNIYLDGILQNPNTGLSLLATLDLNIVKSIEVYSAFSPQNFPGAPIGGSINIVTQKKIGQGNMQVTGNLGSFGARKGSLGLQKSSLRYDFLGQISFDAAEDNFPYYDDNGSEFISGRDSTGLKYKQAKTLTRKIKQNNAHDLLQINGLLRLHSENLEWGLQSEYSDLGKQIPDPFARATNAEIVQAEKKSHWLSLRTFLTGDTGPWPWNAQMYSQWTKEVYVDTVAFGQVGLGSDYDENLYSNSGLLLSLKSKNSRGFIFSALGNYDIATYGYTNLKNRKTEPSLFHYTGEGKFSPGWISPTGQHTLQLQIDYQLALEEYYAGKHFVLGGKSLSPSQSEKHFSGQVEYQANWKKKIQFYTQAGNAFRFPSFIERYGDQGSLAGNANLKAETSLHYSQGMIFNGEKFTLGAKYYHIHSEGLIHLEQNSQYILYFTNSEKVTIKGEQFQFSTFPWRWTHSDLEITHESATSEGNEGADSYRNGKQLPYRPFWQGSFSQVLLWGDMQLANTVYYQGLTFTNPSNSATIYDAYSSNTNHQWKWNVNVTYKIPHALLLITVENISNSQLFDYFSYPLPGRAYQCALQINI